MRLGHILMLAGFAVIAYAVYIYMEGGTEFPTSCNTVNGGIGVALIASPWILRKVGV